MAADRGSVFTVHATRPDEPGAVEIVFLTEQEARAYAADRSTDWRVAATSVTRYVVGQLGARHAVAWFIDGLEQPQRAPRPGALYPNDGAPAEKISGSGVTARPASPSHHNR